MPNAPHEILHALHLCGLPASLGFEWSDRFRQWRGEVLAASGCGPVEASFRVLHTAAGFRLRSYADTSWDSPAILIVPAPIKRAYIWDLEPQASIVRRCLRQHMRVYLVEWTEPMAHRFGLADYADRFLSACLDIIEKDSGASGAILAGHSLGGTLATIFSCLHAPRVRALVLLESPLYFAHRADCFAPWVAVSPDAHLFESVFGNISGSFLSLAAVTAAPAEFQWQPCADLLVSLSNPRRLATYLRIQRWMLDEFSMSGTLFAEIVERLYRNDQLMRGTLSIHGRQIGPRNLTSPLLSVVDPRSAVIPPQSIIGFHQACAAPSKKLLRYTGDIGMAIQHVGVLVGQNAHARLWPAIFGWLADAAART